MYVFLSEKWNEQTFESSDSNAGGEGCSANAVALKTARSYVDSSAESCSSTIDSRVDPHILYVTLGNLTPHN